MTAIFSRELKSYYTSITGYVFAAFLLLFAGIYVMGLNLRGGYSNFEYVLGNMSFIFLIITPVLTMRVIAEERRQKTDQLLYSLPLSMGQVVLGKYLAMLVVILLPMWVMAFYPLILSVYGTVDFKTAYSTLVAFFFLAAALASVGTFVSSLTDNQAVAAGLCFGVMLLLYFIGELAGFVSTTAIASLGAFLALLLVVVVIVRLLTRNTTLSVILAVIGASGLVVAYLLFQDSFAGLFPSAMSSLSLFDRFYVFINGVFDWTGLVYYLSVIVFCLYLTVQSMEKRRWNG